MGKKLPKQEDLIKVFLFLVKLNIFLLPFYAVIYFDLKYEPLQVLFASIISSFFSILGFKIVQDGFMLYLGDSSFPIDISFDCLGWKSTYSLFALVAASPGAINDKARFLLKWIPLMLLINFARVCLAIFSGFLFGFNFLTAFHDYVLQPLMIFLVLFVWKIYISDKTDEFIRNRNFHKKSKSG